MLSYPLKVRVGDSIDLMIRFKPTRDGYKAGKIEIFSNDPASPSIVNVSGDMPSGKLAVTGSTSFGGVTACCCADRTISICNVGDCTLHVTSVRFKRKSHHWRLLYNPFPATLLPGSCLAVVIQYKATEKCPRSTFGAAQWREKLRSVEQLPGVEAYALLAYQWSLTQIQPPTINGITSLEGIRRREHPHKPQLNTMENKLHRTSKE